ncbi:MAG: hypothetical protein N2246_11030, partial [Candidatus Sumerlaeia bacterium]|nr:hypothetical protein [Candidatus Sumerlaeia bacterium]
MALPNVLKILVFVILIKYKMGCEILARKNIDRLIGQDVPEDPSVTPGIEDPETGIPDDRNAKAKSTLRNLKSLGQNNIPEMPSDLHCIIIIGQIEGHIVLPPHNKTT